MSDNPQHRATPRTGPKHRSSRPDDPTRADLDVLFPGTAGKKTPAPRKPRRNGALAAAAATGTIAIVYTVAAPREAAPTGTVEAIAAERSVEAQPEVPTAEVPIVQETPRIITEAAPPPPPEPEPAPEPPAASPAPVAAAAPAPPVQVEAAPPAPPAPAPDAGAQRRAAIVAAAYAQIGESQDCVKMVADALAQVGIYWYKWPVEYYQIGVPVSAAEAQPGDLIYYVNGMGASVAGMAHIAIYVGDGMAVHGGWNGWTTVLFSVNVGSGPNYIRITA